MAGSVIKSDDDTMRRLRRAGEPAWRHRCARLGRYTILSFVMSALATPFVDVDLRSYGERWGTDRHDFAQLVLPVSGAVDVGVLGQCGQRFTLTRRAGDTRVVKLGTGGDLPKALLTSLSQLALTQ